MAQCGCPTAIRAGQVMRGLVIALVGQKPMPLAEVTRLTGKHRTTVLWHLARLQERGRIAGYSTAGGMVRVWESER